MKTLGDRIRFLVSIMAVMLKHQAINTHDTDSLLIIPEQIHEVIVCLLRVKICQKGTKCHGAIIKTGVKIRCWD